MTDDQITIAQVIAPDLRLGHVDIKSARLIVTGAKETNPIAHDLEDTSAQLQAFSFGLSLSDAQDQVIFLSRFTPGMLKSLAICRKLSRGVVCNSRTFMGIYLYRFRICFQGWDTQPVYQPLVVFNKQYNIEKWGKQ